MQYFPHSSSRVSCHERAQVIMMTYLEVVLGGAVMSLFFVFLLFL